MSDAAHESRSRAWVDLSIRTKGLIVIAVPVLLLFALLGALIWFTQTDREAQAAGTQARSVLSTASMLEGALFDAHTDATGFIVTGDSSFLAAYQKAVAPVPGQLAQLRAGAGRSPAELAAIGAVDRDATALLAALSQGTHSDAPPQNAATLLHQTEAASGRLRAGVTALDAVENRSLAADHGAVSAANRNLVVAGIVAVFLGLAGGFLAMWLFTDGVATRLRRLERATTADADVFSLADLPEGEDEIGRLASRFTRTTSELAAWAEERDRARDQLEEILTASPIVSLRYQDASRRFTYASPNVERLLGLSAGEVLADGGLLAGRIHPEDLERLAKAMEDGVVRRGDRVSLSLRFRRDPESPAWGEADTVITPDIGADGTIVGAVVYLVDSSERHTAQRAADERRFMLESIFRASPDTIAVRDEVGRVVLASTSLAEVMGTDDTPEIGPPAADSRRLIDELAARSAAASQDMGPVVTSARGSDGAVHLFETRARPVLDEFGTVTGTVTISRDITERIRLEESLRDATASAERASEAKSEFLSRMSHELRTPLNAILGFAQLLELDELPGDQASSVDQIQRAGRHLLSLINEVLDISRIEAGQLSIDTAPVDVADVLVEVTTLLTPVAEAAGAELSVDTAGAASLWVHADRQRLLQVLLNLGSNALKYGGLHGAVTFATLVERSGEGEPVVRFEVSDRGPGIPRDKQDEIWVPFARIGAERTRVEGTGVGLALSKHLVELMGGSIGVRSRLGEGATFWITLRTAVAPTVVSGVAPAPPAAAPVPARARTPAGRPDQRRPADHDAGEELLVLQIEDNASNASLVAQVLGRRPGVRLLSAATARGGLELAMADHPDLVLLDLHLPDMSGDEVVERLKAEGSLAETKIVVVSADATPSRIRRMLDLGVDGYLTKPVGVEALLRLVDRELEGTRT